MGRHRHAPPAAPAAARPRGRAGRRVCSTSSRGTSRRRRPTTPTGRRCASPSRCAIGRSSRPPTPRACGSASWPRPISDRSTCGAARSGSSARAARSGSACSDGPPAQALAAYLEDGRPVLLERRHGGRGAARRDLPEPPRRSARRPRPALPARPPVRACRAAAGRLAAHPPPLVRDPPARRRRRPARRPGAARPREPGDDPDLHPRLARSPPGRLSGGPSAGPSRPDPVTRDRRARPRRAHRLGRVPRLARPRLRPGRRHRQRVRVDRARRVLRRVPDPGPDLPARRRGRPVVGADPDHLGPVHDRRTARAWRVVSTVINLMLIALLVLAVALFILAPVVVPLITPGFERRPSSTRPSS